MCVFVCVCVDNSGFSSQVRSMWLKNMFEDADKDGSGSLSVKEVLVMMKELNVSLNKKVLKKKFKVSKRS